MLGEHNVLNAAAAIVLCLQEGIAVKVIQDSLSNFMGIDRRMQILGEKKIGGSNCLFIDDYGQNPIEGINSSNIQSSLIRSGFDNVKLLNSNEVAKEFDKDLAKDTVFVFQGAGDISSISQSIFEGFK
jgi:UDP-N-acetylmuramate-alanine ligase